MRVTSRRWRRWGRFGGGCVLGRRGREGVGWDFVAAGGRGVCGQPRCGCGQVCEGRVQRVFLGDEARVGAWAG